MRQQRMRCGTLRGKKEGIAAPDSPRQPPEGKNKSQLLHLAHRVSLSNAGPAEILGARLEAAAASASNVRLGESTRTLAPRRSLRFSRISRATRDRIYQSSED